MIKTAASANLSLNHGAAAWNCLSGFWEQGILSSGRFCMLCFAIPTWIEVFELYLLRSPNNKPKPMKQALLTLGNVLSKVPDRLVGSRLKEHVIGRTVEFICGFEDCPFVKPAFQVLEHFLSKGIVEASHIMLEIAQKKSAWEQNKDFDKKVAQMYSTPIPQSVQTTCLKTFVFNVLEWVPYPDIAPAAGSLLVAFFSSLHASHFQTNQSCCLAQNSLLWAAPLRAALERWPSLIEFVECHVLSGLLLLSSADMEMFLDTLPIRDLQNGNTGSLSDTEIQLSLLTMRICLKMKCSRISGMFG